MKKYGFTLVELLAVIVIIAIIAVIVVPIILNVVEDSRKKSAIESMNGYMDAIEKAISLNELKQDKNFPKSDENGCYDLTSLNKFIKVKGNQPIILNNAKTCLDQEVTTVEEVVIDGYKIKYSNGKYTLNGKEYPVKDDKENQQFICTNTGKAGYEIGTKYSCDPGDGKKRNFYVIEEKENQVLFIMDSNIGNSACLTKEDYVANGGSESNYTGGRIQTGSSPLTALNYLKQFTKNWNQVEVSLPKYSQLNSISPNDWLIEITRNSLYNSGYLLDYVSGWGCGKAIVSSGSVTMSYDAASYMFGIRPVITVLKSEIQ